MKKEFLLSIVGGVLLLSSVAIVPAHGATAEDLKYMTQTQTKSTPVTHQTYIETDWLGNLIPTTQIKTTRQATTEELNGGWTTYFDGRSTYWTYHLSDGTPYEGWLNENGAWYYIRSNRMLTNCYVEGFYLGADGVLTTPPATFNYHYYLDVSTKYRTITPQDVQATKVVREKLLKEGWIEDIFGSYWLGDVDNVYFPSGKDGIKYSTSCHIVAGVATVTLYTESGYKDYDNRKNWTNGDSHTITLPVEKYLEYKKEGNVGRFTVYWSVNGGKPTSEYNEYLVNN
ncbi:hypothetical protein [Clostridium beijerinckii]|uniref:hypothetical protein n=1 Tax=Clostridium beijerinckii TaxID=1520 RepID=UPI002330600C|nr:hypothetical protein [Clostridium beijerinckii]